jgi:peptidylprolyl isomerase
MSRRPILAAAALAVSAVALSGCLDVDNPIAPAAGCTLTAGPLQDVAGDTLSGQEGLKYIERTVGTGDTAQNGSSVDVCYVGRFTNGQAFDAGQIPSSGDELVIGQANLITGFDRGLVDLKVGGIRRLILPPELGYGNVDVKDQAGNVIIPANSTLVFDVQLLRIR